MPTPDTSNESELRRTLQQFVDTIEATGGVESNGDWEHAPAQAPEWLDLGLAYVRAVRVLAETAPHTPPESLK